MYSTNLTDAQWRVMKQLLPKVKKTKPRTYQLRDIISGILYHTKTGVQWRLMPPCFPPWKLVYYYYRKYRLEYTWDSIMFKLNKLVRRIKDKHETPQYLVIDSQSVPDSDIPRLTTKGKDGHKKISGIKRTILTDDLGLIWRVSCNPANVNDVRLGEKVIRSCFESKTYPITVKVIFGDKGFYGKRLQNIIYNLFSIYLITPLKRFKRKVWTKEDQQIFKNKQGVIKSLLKPRRYIVEQTNSHLNQNRFLIRNYTRKLQIHETEVKLAGIRKCLKHIV